MLLPGCRPHFLPSWAYAANVASVGSGGPADLAPERCPPPPAWPPAGSPPAPSKTGAEGSGEPPLPLAVPASAASSSSTYSGISTSSTLLPLEAAGLTRRGGGTAADEPPPSPSAPPPAASEAAAAGPSPACSSLHCCRAAMMPMRSCTAHSCMGERHTQAGGARERAAAHLHLLQLAQQPPPPARVAPHQGRDMRQRPARQPRQHKHATQQPQAARHGGGLGGPHRQRPHSCVHQAEAKRHCRGHAQLRQQTHRIRSPMCRLPPL
jgi:hypothetical protein